MVKGVPAIAEFLGVTPQRVRWLLAQQRIQGAKDPVTGKWQIPFPPVIRHGARGPRLGRGPRSGQLAPGVDRYLWLCS